MRLSFTGLFARVLAARTLPILHMLGLLGILAGISGMPWAAELHGDIVSKNAVSFTPVLVSTTDVPKPHIDALEQVDRTIFAGGLFESVAPAGGSPSYARQNFVAFDAQTGKFKSEMGVGYTDPVFDDQVWAIAKHGNAVFVGGEFNTVNGIVRRRLVKIDAATGAVDPSFNAGFPGGIVWDLQMWDGPDGSSPTLIVAGSMGKKLIALNPITGANTNFINLGISDPLPSAWGGVAVYRVALHPTGTKLVATGNFQTVAGESRTRLFIANLTGTAATLDSWYYPGFAKPCASTHPRRIAYLQDVDFSPDGSYFVVTATGQIPKFKEDIWPAGSGPYHTVCDAAGRFDLADDQHPVWINYTGGDSVWAAAATGAAVYVQGHFLWLDNPNGWASKDGGGAVQRLGIGAIHPATGKALAWNPAKPAQIGGKALLATPEGLWVGSDSLKFDGDPHRGIALAPLPSVLAGAGDIADCSSAGDDATAELLNSIPGVVFTVGDNAYSMGSTVQYDNCYDPSWGAQKSRTKPSPGDRDYLTAGAAGYFGYFGSAAGLPSQGYYSYEIGYWHIIVLNSMCEKVGGCGATSPMITWLKADLAANTSKCTLAYFHHPLFSSGLTGNVTKMRPAWNALYAARADVVISAHDNIYERFARQESDGDLNTTRGIMQFVVGTGGATHSPFGTIKPNSEVRNNDTFGVLKLKLHPKSYDWEFVPVDGGTFTDSGSTNCH